MSKQRPKQNFSQSLDRYSQKFRSLQEQVVSNVNSLIGVIGRTEQDIAAMQEQDQVHERLEKLHSSIAQLKPLSSITNLNQKIYAHISKIGKELDITVQSGEQGKHSRKFEDGLVELTILEHFLKSHNRDAANALNIEHQLKEVFETGLAIYEQILNGYFTAAIQWAESQRLYETFDIDLQFELRKRQFLQRINSGKKQEAVAYCKQTMAKFMVKRMRQIQELMGYMVFAELAPNDRYEKLRQLSKDTESMAKNFLEIYYEHNGIANFDCLEMCLRFGVKFQRQFQTYEKSLTKESTKKEVLPFSVDTKQSQYHSMFVCPVWKEVSNPHDKPIVLKCGHVIAEYSFNRIVDNRTKTKFRCPVCHAQQRTSDTVQMHF